MEIECRAPEGRSIDLWVEPWGDRVSIPQGSAARLIFEGEAVESLVIEWMDRALWLGLPRNTVLRVLSDAGEVLGEYDTNLLPPTPPGVRPI
jgi:hypothetical protein